MCGIVGFRKQNVTEKDIEMLRSVLIESRIRGMHASGIAWFNGTNISFISKPIPIDELVSEINLNDFIYNNSISLIAHARYSTSDLEYNQPIVSENLALVHNGVITQESPENWERIYGYRCMTKNDSELLLRALLNGDNPYEKFESSSISALTLNDSGTIKFYRNGRRPMWIGDLSEGFIIASTKDILMRSGVPENSIVKVTCRNNMNDLQRRHNDSIR